MDIIVYNVRDLPEELWLAWDRIQHSNSELESPFFCAQFARTVGAVRYDAEVGVLFQDGEPAGFFPFHRGFLGVGRPLAGHLSDYQAVIAEPGLTWSPAEIIRGCGLSGWDFDHVLASHSSFEPHAAYRVGSPFIGLPHGFEGYRQHRQLEGSKVLKSLGTLGRKLEREVGPIRFAFHEADEKFFDQVLKWKREQYKESKVSDVFADNWTVELLRRLFRTQSSTLSGMLSILWAGDIAVAMHLGMRSKSVWHYWFPAYDPQFYRYSPGMLLLLEMVKSAEQHGLQKIDLGKGDSEYKMRMMTGSTPLLEGSIIVSSPVRWARKSWFATKACVRGALRYPVRLVRRWKPSQEVI